MAAVKKGRTVSAPGQVNYDTVGERPEFMRWRRLRHASTGKSIEIYGYTVKQTLGPWVGYEKHRLDEAPCVHCGQTNVFQTMAEGKQGFHLCPGHFALPDSAGQLVPCGHRGSTNDKGEHVCMGKPSMSYHGAGRWTVVDGWTEIT